MNTSEPSFSPRDLPAERIRELERAVQDAIDYLRRLTPVPVTVAKAAELETVLRGASEVRDRSYATAAYSPAGIPRLSAEFIGSWLFLKCPASEQAALESDLIGYLRAGVRLQCQQKTDHAPFSELELAFWEAHPRGRSSNPDR